MYFPISLSHSESELFYDMDTFLMYRSKKTI
ncbi:hypothetical protein CI610_00251 [invertebrate metagenome]|uniref:Uncharacterized protein n=1 Tax=invertebrate metagenome TaxID=1711999 RepID=A0A2H9TC36_9ZZZZ